MNQQSTLTYNDNIETHVNNHNQNNLKLFLEGFHFLIVGLDLKPNKLINIKRMIKSLGGKVSDQFTNEINIGIINRVGLTNHRKLKQYRIQCVTIRWLYDCDQKKTLLSFGSYRVLPLQGLVIVCTQIDLSDRKHLEMKVNENGGEFNHNLVKDNCTHLVAIQPEGDKYIHAKSWKNIHIVKLDWIDECIRRKEWIAEVDYYVTSNSNKPPIRKEVSYGITTVRNHHCIKPNNNNLHTTTYNNSNYNSITNTSLVATSSSKQTNNIIEQINRYLIEKIPINMLPKVNTTNTTTTNNNNNNNNNSMNNYNSNIFRNEIFWISPPMQQISSLNHHLTISNNNNNSQKQQQRSEQLRDYMISCIISGGGRCSMVLFDGVTKMILLPHIVVDMFTTQHKVPSDHNTNTNSGNECIINSSFYIANEEYLSLAKKHSFGLEVVNLVWLIEHLFAIHVIIALVRNNNIEPQQQPVVMMTPLQRFFQYIVDDQNITNINNMEDLVTLHDVDYYNYLLNIENEIKHQNLSINSNNNNIEEFDLFKEETISHHQNSNNSTTINNNTVTTTTSSIENKNHEFIIPMLPRKHHLSTNNILLPNKKIKKMLSVDKVTRFITKQQQQQHNGIINNNNNNQKVVKLLKHPIQYSNNSNNNDNNNKNNSNNMYKGYYHTNGITEEESQQIKYEDLL